MRESPQDPFNPYRYWPADIEGELFARLIDCEVDFVVPERYYDNEESKRLRRYAVEYIEKLHLRKRGERSDALIPYTAMTYFDRFCSEGAVLPVVGDTETDLCLTCCLIIAWKLRTETFNLPQFLVDKKLKFTAESVLHMELQICKRLKWRIRALTPFTFVNYFLQMLELLPGRPSPLHRVNQLILTSQCAIAFTKYRPSVVAAAAMRVVVGNTFASYNSTLEFKIHASELVNPHLEMIGECDEKLGPLYRSSAMPAAEEGPGLSIALEKPPLGEIRLALAEFKSYPVNTDELLNFELSWVAALEELDAQSAAAAGDAAADGTSNLAQKLTECCNGFRHGCHIQ